MNQISSDEGNPTSRAEATPRQLPNEFFARLGLGFPKSPVASILFLGTLICLAGWGALSIFYQVAIFFVHPDVALWLCVALGCTGLVLVLMRRPQWSNGANELKEHVPNEESRQSRRWTSAKPWFVLVLTFCIYVLLVRSMRGETVIDKPERIVIAILMAGIYLAIWMLVCRLERHFNRGLRKNVAPSPKTDTSTWQDDWKSAPWWGIGIVICGLLLRQSGQNNHTPSRYDHVKMIPFSRDGVTSWNQKRQSTLVYWQSAVTNLHPIRFQIPSGEQSSVEYFDQRFKQLQTLTELAKSASTINVDPELVQMANRHLVIDDQWLQLKQQSDQLMQREALLANNSTVDQQKFIWQFFLAAIQSDPTLMEKMPQGPERALIEKVIVLEQQREAQFREIEQMQAVLQERYKGTTFPLPTLHP
eukprot:TRINITY_DN2081_c0_g2_i1.p1 TRINITY_DN2081_c0_g2~~TRINITY_DN2081_c0_g2_i1.p1  ORF type:complete len:418 (-),score=78.21 TRINITY_DN2081_c0_g2_i1:476-1729(-)